MTLQELREESYKVISRVRSRAVLSDRTLDEHEMDRLEALLGQIEVFTKQHHKNCE